MYLIYPGMQNNVMARNFTDFSAEGMTIKKAAGWTVTEDWTFENVPAGEYLVQALWDQNLWQSGIRDDGNSYSKPVKVTINGKKSVDLTLENVFKTPDVQHELLEVITIPSQLLSDFWKKPMEVKASVLLPNNYEKGKMYPIRYHVAGYGGRYARVARLLNDEKFMSWWTSEEAPEIINVFLDGYGPYGDCYQMDSENSGPYGQSLIEEQIPFIEEMFRGTVTAENRFVDGCSTGGYVSLGLQLFYPDEFAGCFSYSPDAVDFRNFQLINVYEDTNAFVSQHGYEIPMRRSVNGEPIWSMREFIKYENIQSPTNVYTQSSGQFSAFMALYSPKGEDGLPAPLFHPTTGSMDTTLRDSWRRFDYLDYAQKNWKELGPKVEGKIFVSVSDMDDFYLSYAMRQFYEYLETTTSPKSDAEIEFLPYTGHCRQYSHKIVLKQIEEKMNGKYFRPSEPTFSFSILAMNS